MNDTSKSGRWLLFQINSMDDLVIAEADRKLGDHIKGLSIFNKACIEPTKFSLLSIPAGLVPSGSC